MRQTHDKGGDSGDQLLSDMNVLDHISQSDSYRNRLVKEHEGWLGRKLLDHPVC